ncbi:Synaptonemal complex protein 1 [Desmophyllum pertusum]|uniref:Synaptonemal complex protein 1 n=1 Tax=Desmophyllum pertusum TaxID=174260 RepID=A0A9W9ZDI4_9CNID|nr:Synaptonemal complex protein 1 [Desmophyllum pertusum]
MQSHAHSQLKHHIPQPLFKLTTSPVSHSPQTSSSYFASPNVNKSAYHGHQMNIRPVNSPSNTYFRQTLQGRKKKEKKLHEAVQTIDSQRKSILDLQFQNESLSSKLQEELASREEVEHK